MPDTAFDREKLALQRGLREILPKLLIDPKNRHEKFDKKQTVIAQCLSCFCVETT